MILEYRISQVGGKCEFIIAWCASGCWRNPRTSRQWKCLVPQPPFWRTDRLRGRPALYSHSLSLFWQGAGPRTPAGSSHLVLSAYDTAHVLRSENNLQLFLFFQLMNPESQTRVSELAESTLTHEPSGHSPNLYFIKKYKLSGTLGVHQSLSTSLSAQPYLWNRAWIHV